MAKPVTTVGREMIAEVLPEDLRHYASQPMDSKAIKSLFQQLAEEHKGDYVDILQELSGISRDVVTDYGKFTSLRLKDLDINELPKSKALQDSLRAQVRAINQSPSLTPYQKRDKVVALVSKQAPVVRDTLMKEGLEKENAFVIAAKHGFRGNPHQITQLLFGDLIMSDSNGNPVPMPGLTGYGEGTSPEEYWGGTYGSRAGFAAVQFSTADSGYLGKQLTLASHAQRVTGPDCGAKGLGLPRDGGSQDNLGALLSDDAGPYKAGDVITEEMLPKLKGKEILVRSPLTCRQEEGVCQACLGLDAAGHKTPIGTYVGPGEARAASEPFTQMGLGAKHTGGLLKDEDPEQGFEALDRFFQVPEHYPGAAALAPVDGTITKIAPAPQGGSYVFVGQDQIHVPAGQSVTAKKGDTVEAGDSLSDGILNPAEIVKHKGLGAGRLYFVDQLKRMMDKNGIDMHRRQLEVVTKGFLDRIVMDDEDIIPDTDIGGIMNYSTLQSKYVPRKDSKKLFLTASSPTNLYLEEPVLHYTIGTRLTPKVRDTLRAAGRQEILTHADPPGFTPEVTRLAAAITKDPDWRARLAGFHLKKSFLDSVTHGSTSSNTGASFIPSLIRPDTIISDTVDTLDNRTGDL